MSPLVKNCSAWNGGGVLALLALLSVGCGQPQQLPADRSPLRVAADAGALRPCTLNGGCDANEVCANLDLEGGQVLRCIAASGDACTRQLACEPGFSCYAFASNPPIYFCGKPVPKDAGR